VLGTGCLGGKVDTVADIQSGLTEACAQSGPSVVSITAGSYSLSGTLTVDCTSAPNDGVVLRPIGGQVIILRGNTTDQPVFTVKSPHNTFQDLRIEDSRTAFLLDSGADFTTIRGVFFTSNKTRNGDDVILVRSSHNTIEANAIFHNSDKKSGTSAIHVKDSHDNVIAMNAIVGPFVSMVWVEGTAGGTTFIDHNTISMRKSDDPGGVVMRLQNAAGLCVRNNILHGRSDSTGLALDNVTLADAQSCNGSQSVNNVNANSGTACSGSGCATLCTSAGPLCDRSDSVDFSFALCLDSESTLIDAGLDVGYDLWDSSPLLFNGSAPEVGARESGVGRSFGGTLSFCP
jgi:hypothetical protein